jgi:hypothetical protein
LQNEAKRHIQIPNVIIQQIFPAGIGRLLIRTMDTMVQ